MRERASNHQEVPLNDPYERRPIPLVYDQKLFDMHLETKLMELETKLWMRAFVAALCIAVIAMLFWKLPR
jgi:hypothetical protein